MGKIKRIWWQISGLILFNFPFIGQLTLPWLPVPVLNCYSCPLALSACPIGTIQHFLVIGAIPIFTVGIILLFSTIAGRFYCSHLCPFGFLQDLLARITRHKVRIPNFLGYGKYAVLIITVILLPPLLKEPFFCTLCPAGSIEAGIPIVLQAWFKEHFAEPNLFSNVGGILSMIGWWFWFKIALLVAILITAVFIKRPFCRTACPLGALLGIFNRISLFFTHPGIKSDKRNRYYLRTCPVGITNPRDVDSHNCIKCRECHHPPDKKN